MRNQLYGQQQLDTRQGESRLWHYNRRDTALIFALSQQTVYIDSCDDFISEVNQILGILISTLQSDSELLKSAQPA